MTFTLTLDLAPGTTYAEIQRQVELVASKLPIDESKPDGPERINIVHVATGSADLDVIGEWRIGQKSPSVALAAAMESTARDLEVHIVNGFFVTPGSPDEKNLKYFVQCQADYLRKAIGQIGVRS